MALRGGEEGERDSCPFALMGWQFTLILTQFSLDEK